MKNVKYRIADRSIIPTLSTLYFECYRRRIYYTDQNMWNRGNFPRDNRPPIKVLGAMGISYIHIYD